jgi:hypothetical protein
MRIISHRLNSSAIPNYLAVDCGVAGELALLVQTVRITEEERLGYGDVSQGCQGPAPGPASPDLMLGAHNSM